jgi:ketosteroid isomerase-like protein
MGVYIKGMEMPKDKAVAVVIHPDGTAYTAEMFAGVCTEYLSDCTAVPVPPHGRLIEEQWLKDAIITTLEALKKNPKMDKQEMHLIAAFDTLRVMVEDAPTIIEAEEGET